MTNQIGLNLLTLKVKRFNDSIKSRVWFYQYKDGKKEKLIRRNGYWYYFDSARNTCEIGSNTLYGAKGDLIYSEAKVWSEYV